MCMSSPSTPTPPPPPPPATEAPTKADPAVQRRRTEERKRARSLAGDKSTLSTGPRGLMAEASTGQSTLLGG